MRRLVAWNLMTLDGYFEGKTPWALDFHETVWGDELHDFSLEQGREAGTLLFGRRTYEGMADYWTKATGDIADMMNSIDKAVATRTLDEATWNNTRLLKGEAVDDGAENDDDDEDEDDEEDSLEAAEIFADGEELATSLAEDVWPSALKYYGESIPSE